MLTHTDMRPMDMLFSMTFQGAELTRVGQNVFQIPRQKGPVKTERVFVFTAFLKKGLAGSRAALFHLFPHLSLQQLTQFYIKGRYGR